MNSAMNPAMNVLTPTPKDERKGYSWTSRPSLAAKRHKVSFSGSSKGSASESQDEASSRSASPKPWAPSIQPTPVVDGQTWQVVDRQKEAIFVDATPTPQEAKPFLVYDDSFLKVLGNEATVQVLIDDRRAPYFYNGGVYHSKSNTFFVSSAPIPDSSPAAAPSKNLAVVMSKVEFFDRDYTRDKVRTGETSFMFGSGCNYGAGIILCSHGTLKDPACLVFMEIKRPHKMHILLTNYMGQTLNSPHSCVAHSDGTIWFSDPHITPYRPKPKLPPMIYRFNPQTSDLKAITNDVKKPTCLAFSLSCKTLYVVDGAVYAFTVLQPYGFVTQKRLFAWLDATALAVDTFGNVFIAVNECIYVYAESGSLIGRINIEKCTGLCFGKSNQLWASTGEKLWKIQLDTKKMAYKT